MGMPSDWGTQIVDRAVQKKAPKWATRERSAILVERQLSPRANMCLLGHTGCTKNGLTMVRRPDGRLTLEIGGEDHYSYMTHTRYLVADRIDVPAERGGEKMRDDNGAVVTRDAWKPRAIARAKVMVVDSLAEREERDQIAVWVAEDRNRASYEWRFERDILQKTNELGRFKGDGGVFNPHGLSLQRGQGFDPVERDQFYTGVHKDHSRNATQADFYILGYGFNPVTRHRVALIRVPSTTVRLMVDLDGIVKGRNARKKAFKYAVTPPEEVLGTIHERCRLAVRRYWQKEAPTSSEA